MSARVEQIGTESVLIVESDGKVTRRTFSSKSQAEETKKAIHNAEALIRQSGTLGDWEI